MKKGKRKERKTIASKQESNRGSENVRKGETERERAFIYIVSTKRMLPLSLAGR